MQSANQSGKRSYILLFFIFLTFNFALFIVIACFFNHTLFILHGFDVKLIKGTSTESFDAYRKVYSSKLPFLLSLVSLSIVSFYWIVRLRQRLNGGLYSILFLVFGLVTIISVAFFFFYFIVPTNFI